MNRGKTQKDRPTWRRLHRYNAIFLFAFIVVHMMTHLSGVLGIETYNAVQSAFRVVYRNAIVEVVLLASISAQLIIGAVLLGRRIRGGRTSGFWGWLQILSGGYFLLFMVQHLYSLGMTRLYFDLDTNFYWPASVMSGPWFVYYFTPYYVLGVFSVLAHIGAGLRFGLISQGKPVLANRISVSFLVGAAAVALAIPPIIAGALYPIELPQEWIDYLRFYSPTFNQ